MNETIENGEELINDNQILDLLENTDMQLIDKEYIYNKSEEFINLYNTKYLSYIEELVSFTKKYYNNKKYKLVSDNKTLKIYDYKKEKEIVTINKPKIKNLKLYLSDIKNKIQRDRNKLKQSYNEIIEDKLLTKYKLSNFNSQKKKFINKLNEYYAIQLYNYKINNINLEDKKITNSKLIDDKIFFNIQYIKPENLQTYINSEINLRNLYINANNDINEENIKNYLIEKDKLNKYINYLSTEKKEINIIILEKYLFNNFIFNFKNNKNN